MKCVSSNKYRKDTKRTERVIDPNYRLSKNIIVNIILEIILKYE